MKRLSVFLAAVLCGAAAVAGTEGESVPRVVPLLDRASRMPGSLFHSTEEKVGLKSSYPSAINVVLLSYKDGRCALIDTGFGPGLQRELAERKIPCGSISAVFITHIHPDHVGGLVAEDDRPAFPKAKIYVARREYEAWQRDPRRAALGKCFEPCRERIVLFDFDKALENWGLLPLLYPGHTPGHTVFKIAGKEAYFVGDIVHAVDLQVPHPGYCAKYDMEPARAVASRRELLMRGGVRYGSHIPFPGCVRISRAPDGTFRAVPVN